MSWAVAVVEKQNGAPNVQPNSKHAISLDIFIVFGLAWKCVGTTNSCAQKFLANTVFDRFHHCLGGNSPIRMTQRICVRFALENDDDSEPESAHDAVFEIFDRVRVLAITILAIPMANQQIE